MDVKLFKKILVRCNNDGRAIRRVLERDHSSFFLKAVKRSDRRGVELRQAIYDSVYRVRKAPTCGHEDCDTKTKFLNYVDGYGPYCSRKCANSSTRKAERVFATLRTKYGVDNVSQVAAFQRKKVKTFRAKYGCDNPSKSDAIKRKIMRSHRTRYGAHFMSTAKGKAKHKEAVHAKLGVDNPFQSEAVKRKSKRTLRRKRGVDYVQQCSLARARTRATTKARYGTEHHVNSDDYKARMLAKYGVDHPYKAEPVQRARLEKSHAIKRHRIEGRVFHCRGYEHHAIRWLIRKRGVDPKSIAVTAAQGLPSFQYMDGAKLRRYFPDIMADIGDKTWIIEVKSAYTAGATDKNLFEAMRRKARAVRHAGQRFMLLVFDADGNLLMKSTKAHKLKFRQLSSELA